MNNLKEKNKLKNRYFVLRHGESKSNVLGIILSSPEEGVHDWGLSDTGRDQVRKSAKSALERGVLDRYTIIYSSDFLRAMETAEITREVLGAETVIINKNLRERNFGNFERTESSNYQKVWNDDKLNPNHNINNVESANDVQKRVTNLILDLEIEFKGKKILLVSHGDALQILQTDFLRYCASKHRDVKHLNTAEVRELILK